MKKRVESINFIKQQFKLLNIVNKIGTKQKYGYTELRDLLDFLYEEKPHDNERLIKWKII